MMLFTYVSQSTLINLNEQSKLFNQKYKQSFFYYFSFKISALFLKKWKPLSIFYIA